MCINCETYEYSGNCGPLCSDHNYERDAVLSDEEDDFYRCTKCGSVK